MKELEDIMKQAL